MDLLREQVKYANIIVMNKCDLVDGTDDVREAVDNINPDSSKEGTTLCKLDNVMDILNTESFKLPEDSDESQEEDMIHERNVISSPFSELQIGENGKQVIMMPLFC